MSHPAQYIVVDTDVFSYIWQGHPEASKFAPALQGKIPVISFVTVAEAEFGAASRGWGEQKRRQLAAAEKLYVIAPYTADLARLWGSMKAQCRKSGHPLGQNEHANDLWIAATAAYYGAPLATNNRRHFDNLPNLTLVSPGP